MIIDPNIQQRIKGSYLRVDNGAGLDIKLNEDIEPEHILIKKIKSGRILTYLGNNELYRIWMND